MMNKKTISALIGGALLFVSNAQAAATMRGFIDMKKEKSVQYEVCNKSGLEMFFELRIMQIPQDGISTKPEATKRLRVVPNTAGKPDEPLKNDECTIVSIKQGKDADIKPGEIFNLVSVPVVVEQQNLGTNTLPFLFATNELIFAGNDIRDRAELSGAITKDGIAVNNTGLRGIKISGVVLDDLVFPIVGIQVFGSSKGLLRLPANVLEAVNKALSEGKKLTVMDHQGQKIPVAL